MVNNPTFYKFKAVGISANQLGHKHRYLIILNSLEKCLQNGYKEMDGGVTYCLNPKFISCPSDASFEEDEEGCLSILSKKARVSRPSSILASYFTLEGQAVTRKFEGDHARIFLHELDHLDGILMTDSSRGSEVYENTEFKDWQDRQRVRQKYNFLKD